MKLNGQDSRTMTGIANDPLVQRLSRLEWPKAPTELRERCWQEISRRMELEHGPRAAGNPDAGLTGTS